MSRMRSILEIDRDNQRAVVEPGVINLQLTREALPHGYYYAPDPSSQQVCSIGGNVAENSGGAHCLKYGFTDQPRHRRRAGHARGRGGRSRRQGAGRPRLRPARGCSSAPRARSASPPRSTVRLTRSPEAVQTLLAAFEDTDAGRGGGVGDHRRRGDPRGDRDDGRARHRGGRGGGALQLPARARARSSSSSSTAREEVAAPVRRRSSGYCREDGAFEIRIAADDAERALFWKGRKSAFAAVGRISPDYIVQDGVIPRTALPEVLRRIAADLGRDRASASPTSSTPATATSTRWSSSTTGARARPSAPRRSPARSSTSASSTAARSPASTASARTRRSTCRGCSTEDDLDTMQLVRCAFDPDVDLQPRQGVSHAAPLRRGARPAPRRRTRWSRPASRRCSDGRPRPRSSCARPSTVPATRAARPTDAVDGMPARWVASPGQRRRRCRR